MTAPRFPAVAPGIAVSDRWVVLADCAQVTGLDLLDGEVAWQYRTTQAVLLNDVAAAPRHDPDVVLVVTSNRTAPSLDWVVTAVDLRDGTLRWERTVLRSAVTPDAAVVLKEDGHVIGLDPRTGEPTCEATSAKPPSDLWSVAGAILETEDPHARSGHLRSAAQGRPLLQAEVYRHSLPMPGRTDVQRRTGLVTTATEIALIEDGELRSAVPQRQASCCVSSHVPGDGPVLALRDDGVLLRLDRTDGEVLSARDVHELQETNTTLAGRFVLAGDDPIRDRPMPLTVYDAADTRGWRPIATLPDSQAIAVLPDDDVLFLVGTEVLRLTSP